MSARWPAPPGRTPTLPALTFPALTFPARAFSARALLTLMLMMGLLMNVFVHRDVQMAARGGFGDF